MRHALVLAAALTAALPAAATERLDLSYSVEWGPVALAEVRFVLQRGAGVTALDAGAATVGAADAFAGFAMQQAVRYRGPGDTLYVAIMDRGDGPEQRLVAWEGGVPVRVEAPLPEEELTPIPEGEMAGTVDPAFPWLDTLDRLDAGQGCGGTYRVFDGIRRLDVTVIPAGPEALEDDRGWTYEGPAVACRLAFRRVGGFPVERETVESDYSRTIWFAEIGGGHVPVRLSVEWPLGYATARIDLR